MTRSLLFALVAACMLAVPASALNNRSAVSINGLDTNACTVPSPCRSFGAAIAQTNPGGEIIALDSAGYGTFTVTQSLTISGAPGVHAALTVTFGDGITINAGPSDVVTIRNLVLIGAAGPGSRGIVDQVSGETRVLNCLVRGFMGNGITNLSGRLTVDHSSILDTDDAIIVDGAFAPVRAVISNSLIETYTNGILVVSNASASVTNCTVVGGQVGIGASSGFGIGAVPARAVVESSTIAYNTVAGIQASAAGGNNSAIVYIAQDDILFSPTGVSTSGAATVISFGNNRFAEVGTVGTLSPVSLQ
jgi:hypothetical protein